jgi:Tfp pilus assembly protein FimV
MKDRGYAPSDESAAIGQVSGIAEAPAAVVVQLPDPKPSDPAPQPAPAPDVDQILTKMSAFMELMAS